MSPVISVVQTLVILLIACVHGAALMHDWYFFYPYLDTFVHVLGGFWIACMAALSLAAWGKMQLARMYLYLVPTVVLVACAWELYELAIGLNPAANYAYDTFLDVCAGTFGGILGTYFVRLYSKI
jgi:hypothetical protein